MQRIVTLGLVLALLLAGPAQGASIEVGAPLAPLAVEEDGECVLDGDDTRFVPWDSGSLQGKVQVLEYVAARAGVDDIHMTFFVALKDAALPRDKYQITRVVNSDDALWGTSGLVVGEIEKTKRAQPGVDLVVDAQGLGQQQWALEKKTAALIILDASGTVLFFDQGEITASEVDTALAAVRNAVAASAGD
ncbi:YtfJ family protein [Mangrovimicrobium sediminis]|nr:YtfJ family protein [Haliea sp. SAOS-164]